MCVMVNMVINNQNEEERYQKLVINYIKRIDFKVVEDYLESNINHLLLYTPRGFIEEYQRIKETSLGKIAGSEFLRDTGLMKRLMTEKGIEPDDDICAFISELEESSIMQDCGYINPEVRTIGIVNISKPTA